jgi:NTP pyrophosphatase (non-canonical NTP hydrolase)
MFMPQQNAFNLIRAERQRQEYLKLQGKFAHTCVDDIAPAEKYLFLAEEFGEVSEAIQNKDYENMRDELVQVAAICVAWLENDNDPFKL